MSKKSEVKGDRFSVSADELESRMYRQRLFHDEPITQAVAVLESAIDTVLRKLGVDTNRDDVTMQQEILGIEINNLEGYPGMFVSTTIPEPEPYAWISDAIMNSDGSYGYEIQWFREGRLTTIGGPKIA